MKKPEFRIAIMLCVLFAPVPPENAWARQYPPVPANMVRVSSEGGDDARLGRQAQDFILTMGREAIDFLGDSNLTAEQKKQQFSDLLDNDYDMKTIGRFCLGRYWKSFTPEQQQEYQSLFKDLIVSIYSRQFSNYKGQTFTVDGVQQSNPANIMVQSRIVPKQGNAIPVTWQVRYKNGGFKIVDVKVEGVSMAITKRSEFASIIQRGGGNPEILLQKLRNKEVSVKAGM